MKDMELAAIIMGIANFALTWGVGFYVHIVNKNKATNERISHLEHELDSRLDGQVERIARVEEWVKTAPNHHDLAKLYERINAICASNSRIEGEIKTMADNLRTVMGHIIRRNDK